MQIYQIRIALIVVGLVGCAERPAKQQQVICDADACTDFELQQAVVAALQAMKDDGTVLDERVWAEQVYWEALLLRMETFIGESQGALRSTTHDAERTRSAGKTVDAAGPLKPVRRGNAFVSRTA